MVKKLLVIILISGIIFVFSIILYKYYNEVDNNIIEVTFDKCIDGDTAWFISNDKKEKVRLLGIDTPESTNYIEEYGIDASNYTCSMLKNANDIYLEYDTNSDKYDKYNRVLAWVFVDNNNLSELLLSKGLAYVNYIYGDYKYLDNLCASQSKAYLDKKGIWSTNDYDYFNNYCYKKNDGI